MTADPITDGGSLVTFTIKIDGKAMNSEYQVVSIETWADVNKVPKAKLVIFDGSAATADFEISNLKTFLPGGKVEILAGYDSKEKPIFQGVIVKQGIEIDRKQGSKLIVQLVDEAIKMTLERNNGIFEKTKDSQLIEKLISASGLKKKVTATQTVHEELVQYYATDWDMMMTRAQVNGMVVLVDAGTVTVEPPNTSQSPVIEVEYGTSILDLRAEMNAAYQYASSAIKSYSWDAATQKLIESGPGSVSVKEQGNVTSADLAKVFGVKKYDQQTSAEIDKSSLKEWSSAELLKSKLSKIQGYVRFKGNARPEIGKTIQLGGLGDRFNGSAYISGVHHFINNGVWLTNVLFGMPPRWYAEETTDIEAPEASGLLPGIQGLQVGTVKKVAKDPGGEFRVQVVLPLLQENSKPVWARLATFYASNKVGDVFYPEINDEVIVGFMNNDPRFAVILGSVYSKKHPPAYPPDEKNNKKAITTRSKLELTFDDKDKIIEIKTPGKHIIKMDDKSGAISIKDSNKNTISLSKGGISLDSGSNIKIKAKGNITIDAGANLTAKAKANATMEGLQVSHKAKTKFAASGNAMAEVKASGILTIKGAMVKIN